MNPIIPLYFEYQQMAPMLLYRAFLASSLGGHQAYIHRNICSFIYLFIY